ncbi:hypothetical protein THAOC_20520 [Thalassiosira oceanica]|uniref:HSF-type DNA-binding domain-containing protein n=1 Tax=Thalassiosira oceanica TaxID=159749 RepID=K0SEC0_THAOC|nr:hypothetical protein THAOC_20520 [Thalassiosira oceanica]|eukprot:EJK59281.1 hypothetical protein THAOC_20520 [Thalassiosira oceanica]
MTMGAEVKKSPRRKRKFQRRKRPTNSFPFKLFQLLEDESTRQTGVSRSTVSWSPDGSSFRVNECDRFMSDVACKYFKMTKYRSFLNIWGFSRDVIQLGCDEWFHPSFQRGNPSALSSVTRKDRKEEGGNSNDDRQSDVRRDDAQLQSPGLEVNNDTLVNGAGYLAAGLSGTRPRRNEVEDTRTNDRPVHQLSVARAANTYCPTQNISLQPTLANLNASYEGGATYSRSMPEHGSASIIKSAAGEQDGCLLNDGMSMSKRVSFKRKHSESSMNEHCEEGVTEHELHRLSHRNFFDSLQYCRAEQAMQNHVEQRPMSVPSLMSAPPASIPVVDSDDYLSFLHHMINVVDIDSNIRGDECRSDDKRTEERHEDASPTDLEQTGWIST